MLVQIAEKVPNYLECARQLRVEESFVFFLVLKRRPFYIIVDAERVPTSLGCQIEAVLSDMTTAVGCECSCH